MNRHLLQIIFSISFFVFVAFEAAAQKKAKVINENVDVYSEPDFDADVIEIAQPTDSLIISNKPQGPFYKVKLKNGKVGYIPDTELDIEGQGPFVPKPFKNDPLDSDLEQNQKTKSIKGKTPKKKIEEFDPEEEEKLSYNAVTFQLVNYHEDTLGGTQIGDLFAVGYRNLPALNDFSSSFAWEVSAAFNAPKYYAEKTGNSASGFVLWPGVHIINISPMGSNNTLHYGAGPFLKYSQFMVKSSIDSYTLQDLTLGFSFEGGMIFHFTAISIDLNLRYYWDKKPYGALGFGILF